MLDWQRAVKHCGTHGNPMCVGFDYLFKFELPPETIEHRRVRAVCYFCDGPHKSDDFLHRAESTAAFAPSASEDTVYFVPQVLKIPFTETRAEDDLIKRQSRQEPELLGNFPPGSEHHSQGGENLMPHNDFCIDPQHGQEVPVAVEEPSESPKIAHPEKVSPACPPGLKTSSPDGERPLSTNSS